MRKHTLAVIFLSSTVLSGCATWKPPAIHYDQTPKQAVAAPEPPKPVQIVEIPKPLPLPDQLKPLPVETAPLPEPRDPRIRVETPTMPPASSRPARTISTPSRSIPSRTARSIRSMPRPAR